jgi:uncharacterized protein (DUF488 family)
LAEPVYTIGCSTHTIDHFLNLLITHHVAALADVRSVPYSARNAQFNRDALLYALSRKNIEYIYLGNELGARSQDAHCYHDGKVQYDRLAATLLFQQGLGQVAQTRIKCPTAIMCAEKDPLQCHRTILVARKLVEQGIPVIHILADGTTETHEQVMSRLLQKLHIPEDDLFRSKQEALDEAYRRQGEAIAYATPSEETE